MGYYYVKSGGTATGDGGRYASQQTGTFATLGTSGYYDSVDGALSATTAPASGSFICCSSSHAKNHTSTQAYTMPDGVVVVSVDDANCEQVLEGATESTTSGNLIFNGTAGAAWASELMTWQSEDSIFFQVSGSRHVVNGGTLKLGNTNSQSTDRITGDSDGVLIELNNTDITPSDAAGAGLFKLGRGIAFKWRGGSVNSVTNKPDYLLSIAGLGGVFFECEGVNLSNMGSAFDILQTASAAADDTTICNLRDCTFPASWTLTAPLSAASIIDIQDCDDGNRAIIAGRDILGQHQTVTSTYDVAADTVESQTVSIEIVTSAKAAQQMPYRFLLGKVHADFSTSKDISVDLVHDNKGSGTSSRFTDKEAWIEVHRPNVSGGGVLVETTGVNSFATGSTNASSAAAWTSPPTADNTETITLSTTASGGTGWANVYLCIGVASIASGELYVSHDITVA